MEEILKEAGVIENGYVKAWKEKGGKVVGYLCVATPTEILDAAGVLPYRIRALGRSDTELADAYLSRFNCSFCRSCLQLGLDGTYDFLDGLIETNGCDHLRGTVENWLYVKQYDFFHYLRVPHIMDADSLEYFGEDVDLFRRAVAEKYDAAITDDDLWNQIERQNAVREKLREIYRMRERKTPAFTGAEALSLFLAATSAPAGVQEKILDRAIASRKDHAIEGGKSRLLLAGSATDEVDFVREIENMGGLVVADALCYGSRAFWPHQEVQRKGDPVKSIAESYLKNLLCPRMFDDFASRRKYIADTVERARVDGVILVHNKFCDVHGVDNVQLRLALEKLGVPVLQLEKEYGAAADMGRMKTRVQAFLERIGGGA